jgi:hypothetical protein
MLHDSPHVCLCICMYAVDISTCCGLNGRGARVRVPLIAIYLSSFRRSIHYWAHLTAYTFSINAIPSELKRPERGANKDLQLIARSIINGCMYSLLHTSFCGTRGSVVVKALCYKPEGRGFETRWGEWFLLSYLILLVALGPGVYSASNRNECQKHKNNVSGE